MSKHRLVTDALIEALKNRTGAQVTVSENLITIPQRAMLGEAEVSPVPRTHAKGMQTGIMTFRKGDQEETLHFYTNVSISEKPQENEIAPFDADNADDFIEALVNKGWAL